MPPAGEGSGSKGDRYSFGYPADAADQPAMAVIEAVAWVTGSDASELEPLSNVIDPEALNSLFHRRTLRRDFIRSAGAPTPTDLEVGFEYEGYDVTVNAERILVRRLV